MLLLRIERRRASAPVYRQIVEGIGRLVDTGAFSAGQRLPPTRTLAATLGVHRSTVVRAYQELWALGYLESRPGSYSTVRRPPARAAETAGPPSTFRWATLATRAARRVADECSWRSDPAADGAGLVDFSNLTADRALAPIDEVRRSVRQALLEEGRGLLGYGDPAGHRPLREWLARRLRLHGVAVSADELVVTSGAQQAIDLVLRVVTRPGDRIVVESPTYGDALRLFRLHGLRLIDVQMLEDGMDLERLERRLKRERPRLVYTIPNFHNPTGITSSVAHRERLLSLCRTAGVPILEDGFEEEMKYFGRVALPVKSADVHGRVAYVGTFSKVVFPGLRVGWLAAPAELVRLVVAARRASSLSGNRLTEAAVCRFCEAGHYDAHLRRVHTAYRRRLQVLLEGLAEHLPASGVRFTRPRGGYTLWLEIEASTHTEAQWQGRLLRAGVRLAPGSRFCPRPPKRPCFRLSIAGLDEKQIREGCRRLGQCLRAGLLTRRRREEESDR